MTPLMFRHRIALLVGIAATALIALAVVTLVQGRANARELASLEDRYVPLIELDRDLKTTFAKMERALEDAANAAEEETLHQADRLHQELRDGLRGGASTIASNGGDASTLDEELEQYFTTAREISTAIMGGEPTAALAPKIEVMHRAQERFSSQLDAATSPNRSRIAEAFTEARRTQIISLWIDVAVAVATLGLLLFLSWRIIRRTVTSLHEVSEGVKRLAGGEFDREIQVHSGDEIGDLAREANRTATRLREAREREQAARGRERQLLMESRRQATAAEAANKELEAFSYSVSHDLRAPLRAIDGFSQALLEDYSESLPAKGQDYLRRTRAAAQRMAELIDDLLRLARVTRAELRREKVDLSAIATSVITDLRQRATERLVEVRVQPDVGADADPRLIRITLENLLGNAWKFTAGTANPTIEFGLREEDGKCSYFVRDNGAGFDMKYVERLFGAFQRLHSDKEFPGTGIGLATVQRIIARHGGRIWAEASVGSGATFHFTLSHEQPGADAS